MAIQKLKTEGGQGGRCGHSNMCHYDYTEAIKIAARKRRRLESKIIISKELKDYNKFFLNK